MNWLTNLVTGLKSLVGKRRVEAELDEELAGYVEASAAYKQRAGMNAEAARRAAMVEVGSANAVKHQVIASRWESGLEGLLQDFRLGLRTLAKSPDSPLSPFCRWRSALAAIRPSSRCLTRCCCATFRCAIPNNWSR